MTPAAVSAEGRGGRARAISEAASRKPAWMTSSGRSSAPVGSHTIPDGTPYMTTERRRSSDPEPIRAIHGPGQEKDVGSASGARPIPSPASQRVTVKPVAGSSPGSGTGRASNGSSRIVATQARNELTTSGSSPLGAETSLIARSLPGHQALAHGQNEEAGKLAVGAKGDPHLGTAGNDRDLAACRRAEGVAGHPLRLDKRELGQLFGEIASVTGRLESARDGSRADRRDGDAMLLDLLVESLGEEEDIGLGGGVAGVVGEGLKRGRRGHVDDRAAACTAHSRQVARRQVHNGLDEEADLLELGLAAVLGERL